MRGKILKVILTLVVVASWLGDAVAISVNWLPGFPMKAGNIVMLMWTPVPGATQYKVMRQADQGAFQELGKVPGPPYNDMGVDATITYKYRIIPVVNGQDGDPSVLAEVKGQKKLEPPVIEGTRVDEDGLDMRWKPVQGAAFYNLYRSDKEDGEYALLTSIQDNKYKDTKVEGGKTYFYRLTAVDSTSTESPKSALTKIEMPLAAAKVVVVPEKYVETHLLKEVFGEPGYEFKSPTDVEVLPNGELHVCEFNGVQVFNKEGAVVRRYGANPEKNWSAPLTIGFSRDGKDIYLAYTYEGKIRKFAADGAFVEEFSYAGNDTVKQANPNDIAVDAKGNIWVVDGQLYQIIVIEPVTLKEIARLGRDRSLYKKGEPVPESDFPTAGVVRFNPHDGMMYVGEKMSALIKRIDPKLIEGLDPKERHVKIDLVTGGVGKHIQGFNGIGSFAFTSSGKLIVLDNLLNKVKVLEAKDASYVETWISDTEEGRKKKKLDTNYPAAFDYDERSGIIYVISGMQREMWMFQGPKM